MKPTARKQGSARQRVLKLARAKPMLRSKDLEAIGVPRTYLGRLCEEGVLEHPSRGIYFLAGANVTEHHSLVEACAKIPHGVICLVSALAFHKLTTQIPHEVWMAIGNKSWQPHIDYPPLRICRYSKASLEYGVETHKISGVDVRVYSPAKTVADCFKFRNKIGLDVAIEALRDCMRARKATFDDLWRAGKVCRVAKIMQPYMEMLT